MDIKRIAYLAPELPSLSATFVSNEIFALEAKGLEILPYSVHKPSHPAHGDQMAALAERTTNLYDRSLLKALGTGLKLLVSRPMKVLSTKKKVLSDAFQVGFFSLTAVKLIYQFVRAADLAVMLISSRAQHLHVHFAHVPTQIGMYAADMAGIPFSFMVHANDIFERPLLIKEKVARAHRAVSISQFNVELMREKGADLDRIEIVRCGVDAKQYGDLSVNDRANPIYTIGTIGRLVEKKGIDTLIEAAHTLKASGHEFRMEIAGDGPLWKDLEKMVKNLDLTDRVHFLGSLPHIEVLRWMQQLDVFVLAGKKDRNGDMDGIPVVLMESMMLGVPVISTRLSGIPELVIHEKTGLIGEPDSATDLLDNLTRMMQRSEEITDFSAAAKQWIVSEFDRSLNADRLIRIFNLNQN